MHHLDNKPKEIKAPVKTDNLREIVDEWDFNFIEEIAKSLPDLFALLTAAH